MVLALVMPEYLIFKLWQSDTRKFLLISVTLYNNDH